MLNTELYKNAEMKIYTGIKTLSIATGIPLNYIKYCKKNNYSGFGGNSTVDWRVLKPLFEKNYDKIHDVLSSGDDMGELKKELAKKDIQIKELQIKKMEKNMLEPSDVRELLIEIATHQSVVINSVLDELPPKIAGKSEQDIVVYINKSKETIYDVLKGRLSNWDKWVEDKNKNSYA